MCQRNVWYITHNYLYWYKLKRLSTVGYTKIGQQTTLLYFRFGRRSSVCQRTHNSHTCERKPHKKCLIGRDRRELSTTTTTAATWKYCQLSETLSAAVAVEAINSNMDVYKNSFPLPHEWFVYNVSSQNTHVHITDMFDISAHTITQHTIESHAHQVRTNVCSHVYVVRKGFRSVLKTRSEQSSHRTMPLGIYRAISRHFSPRKNHS